MWKNPRWNSLTGPDSETLRAIFKSLEDFLRRPSFEEGVEMGDASAAPTVDVGTGVVTPVPTSPVDSTTFAGLDADLVALQAELDATQLDLDAAEAAVAAAQADLVLLDADLTQAELDIIAAQADVDAILPIDTADISPLAITAPLLAANSVVAGKIAAGTVTATEIAAATITAAKIAALTITAAEIATNAITASKILAGAITTAKIAAGAVTATEIAAGTITANELAAGSVSTAKLAAGAVTAGKIAANAITAAEIQAFALEVGKYLRSNVYTPGSAGFTLEADGSAEFNNVTVRGDVYANRFTAVEGSVNALTPGTFEATAESWVAGTGSSAVARTSAQAYSGTWSLGITATKGGVLSNLDGRSPSFPVVGGRAYRCQVAIRQPASITVGPTVAWYDSGGTLISSEPFSAPTVAANTWALHRSPIVVAPSNAVTAKLWVRENIASTTNGVAYVDVVTFVDAPMIQSGVYQSDSAAQRIEIASNDQIDFKWPATGVGQNRKAGISRFLWSPGAAGERHQVEISSGDYVGRNPARVRMESQAQDGTVPSALTLDAGQLWLGSSGHDIHAGYSTYTPTINTMSAYGTSTRLGRWRRVGRTIFVNIEFMWNGAYAFGNNNEMKVSLPVAARGGDEYLTAWLLLGTTQLGFGFIQSGASEATLKQANNTSFFGTDVAAGEQFRMWGSYEAAS